MAILSGHLLAAPTRNLCLQQARELLKRVHRPSDRVHLLADLGEAQIKADPTEAFKLFEQAAAAAKAETAPLRQALLLRYVAVRAAKASPQAARSFLQRAAQQAGLVESVTDRIVAFRELGAALRPLDAAAADELWDQAGADISSIAAAPVRFAALRDLAQAVADAHPERARTLFEAAVSAADEIPEGAERDLARLEMAAALAQFDVGQALHQAQLIAAPDTRAEALAQVAIRQAQLNPDGGYVIALQIDDPVQRCVALCGVVKEFATQNSSAAREVLDEASQICAQLPADQRDEARTALILAQAAVAPEQALGEASKLDDEINRETVLAAVIEALACRTPKAALHATLELDDDLLRETMLQQVLPRLVRSDPQQALEVARDIRSRSRRAATLIAMAAQLPPDSPEAPPGP